MAIAMHLLLLRQVLVLLINGQGYILVTGVFIFRHLTFEGQNFKGVGLELNPKHFRFASFYGKINRAIDQDTSRGNFRLPQFSRTAFGVKAGYGSASNFIDLIYFHAKDDSTSTIILNNQRNYRPQENSVVSTAFRVTMVKQLYLTGDFAVSGLIRDISSKVDFDDGTNPKFRKFIQNFLPSSSLIMASYATQGTLNYLTRGYNSNLRYRRVKGNYKSMGTPYMLSDVELVSWSNNLSMMQGKLNLNTSLSQQHNNLDKNLVTELVTQVGNLNINTILGQHFNFNVNLSGYNLRQKNGLPVADTLRLQDSMRLNQRIAQVNVAPGYHVTKGDLIHYINGNINYSLLDDKNRTTARFTNSRNISTALTYSVAFIKKAISLSINSLYTRYKQEANTYTSFGPTAGISARFLKSKSLNVQGNLGCLFNEYNTGNKQTNLTYSLNSSYRARHQHLAFTPITYIRNQIMPLLMQSIKLFRML